MRITVDENTKARCFFGMALLIGCAVLMAYIATGWIVASVGTHVKETGWATVDREGNRVVSQVDPRGPASGVLRPGDEILAINGDGRAARIDPAFMLGFMTPEQTYTVQFRSGNDIAVRRLAFSLRSDQGNLFWVLPLAIVGFCFYAIGMTMGLLKPGDPATQLGFLFSMACAIHFLGIGLYPLKPVLSGGFLVLALACYSVSYFQYALGYHFASRFPAHTAETRFWMLLRRSIYLFCVVVSVPRTAVNLIPVLGQQRATEIYYTWSNIIRQYLQYRYLAEGCFQLLAIISIAAVLTRNYRQTHSAGDQRRLRWLVSGLCAALSPLAVFAIGLLLLSVTGRRGFIDSQVWSDVTRVVNVSLILIPVSLGYAVIKHRVLGVHFVIRRGLQYLLAKNVLRLMVLLPVFGVAFRVFGARGQTLSELFSKAPWSFYSFVIVTAGVSLRYRPQLQENLDRRFFRELYRQEQILSRVVEEVKNFDTMPEVLRMVSTEIDAAFHPASLFALYSAQESQDLTIYYPAHENAGAAVPGDVRLLDCLARKTGILEHGLNASPELPAKERQWLDRMGTHLIVPIVQASGRPTGLLLLGEKKSEEPYTRQDRTLLGAISAQIAIVADNIWLRERVHEEQRLRYEIQTRLHKERSGFFMECPSCGYCFDESERVCSRDGRELRPGLPVGRTIDQKYRLEKRLGKGATGAVYEATDLRLSRKVAVKVMVGNLIGTAPAFHRFDREARAAACLNHPNIITVFDFGSIQGVGAFLVMELLPGRTWRVELRKQGSFSPALVAEYFNQLLSGLAAAHMQGVVHRDLKPENVFISNKSDDQIKILDFGLAKMKFLEPGDASTLTGSGVIMGTIGYMSPEQLMGSPADERSDIFAAGVMLAETLTGARPFRGRTPAEVLTSVLTSGFHLQGDSSHVTRLDAVLQRCIATDPGERFPSVEDMQRALVPALFGCPALRVSAPLSTDNYTTIPKH